MRKSGFLAAVALAVIAGKSWSGPIDAACLKSNRTDNTALCGCIQYVADMTLTGADQRLAAKFLLDPGKAQEVRVSRNRKHQEFWQRYTTFGSTAEEICAP